MGNDAQLIEAVLGPIAGAKIQEMERELLSKAKSASRAAVDLVEAVKSYGNMWPINEFNDAVDSLGTTARGIIEEMGNFTIPLVASCHRIVAGCIELQSLTPKHQVLTASGTDSALRESIALEISRAFLQEMKPALVRLEQSKPLGA